MFGHRDQSPQYCFTPPAMYPWPSRKTSQNYSFVFMPVAIGAIILVAIALLIHNTGEQRRYPMRRGVSARVPVAAEVGIEGQSRFNLKEKDL